MCEKYELVRALAEPFQRLKKSKRQSGMQVKLRLVDEDNGVAYLLPHKVECNANDFLFAGAKSAETQWIWIAVDSVLKLPWSLWIDWF